MPNDSSIINGKNIARCILRLFGFKRARSKLMSRYFVGVQLWFSADDPSLKRFNNLVKLAEYSDEYVEQQLSK